ncbi:MAG: PAS domain S-box protein [Gemmatimonadales bacterium]|nr:PAS domain S-box protein [Gemmatimonadales bacterium]NIN11186.1 PAS domain S-box protein [Gemmatimonadales bacterium]NIN49785.1 PAS domain S-box protein [Gemmatimonadales bacterium]NIP07249.1 PAS domain S-box protein [Gemmatimonadales bacterium]NIR00462.1 PAS domain S-box protein [Gemmatimonadales bacterium]
MEDGPQTREELLAEVDALRRRVAALERGLSPLQDAVQASEERLRILFAAVPDLIIRIRRDGTFLDFSPSTEFATYVPPDRFLGSKMRQLMPPEMADTVMQAIERALQFRTRETVEYELAEREGIRHYEARIVVSGPDEVVAIVRDITLRKSAESALRESEQRYRDLFERSQGIVCTHDLDGNLLSVNPAAAQSVGYEPDELAGTNLIELIVPTARHLLAVYLERIRTEGEDAGIIHVMDRGGEDRYWTYRAVLRAEEGKTPYVIGHALDVTELKRAEQAAQAYEARCRAFFQHSPLAACRVGVDEQVIGVNQLMVDMLGYSSEDELVGRGVAELFASAAARERLLQPCREGTAVQGLEVAWRSKGGHEIVARSSAWSVLLDDDKPDSFQIVAELAPGRARG